MVVEFLYVNLDFCYLIFIPNCKDKYSLRVGVYLFRNCRFKIAENIAFGLTKMIIYGYGILENLILLCFISVNKVLIMN